jgi:hypothetical protein
MGCMMTNEPGGVMMKRSHLFSRLSAALALLVLATGARAAGAGHTDFYGFVMMDAGFKAHPVDPDWFDVSRVAKLESFKDEFGKNGNTFFSVRQTRFGVKSYMPTDLGELKTTFEWELFGTGVDAGQTTLRLRHAYGELGKWGAGQTWSPFMDIDVFPNSLEYWGPSGMAFFRNIQVRYMPIQGDTRMTIALERPGASADAGIYRDRIELANIRPNFPLPDLSAEYRMGRPWGYVEAAGIVREIKWDDTNPAAPDFSGDAVGWGLNLSSNLKAGANDVIRLQFVYGEGIENYMNEGPADIGVKNDAGSPGGIKGVPLPVSGIVAFVDHTWNPKFTSTIGFSQVNIDNTAQSSPSAFHLGQYALANVLYSPVKNVTVGGELQYVKRTNESDGFDTDNVGVQFSFKYNFSSRVGGQD